MPAVRDTRNRRWTVRRRWWPFGTWLLDLPDWGGLFVIGMVLTAPLVVIWPFWLLGRFIGGPWTLVVRCEGKEVRREQVVGWDTSRRRIEEILEESRCESGDDVTDNPTGNRSVEPGA